MMKTEKSLVELANSEVDIFLVCNLIGMDITPAYDVRSIKVYCPFGEVSHIDGGREKALRIYPDTNSAWCWAESLYLSPVKIASLAWDKPMLETAEILLERVGKTPPSIEEMLDKFLNPPEVQPDLSLLGQLLRDFCKNHMENWESRQFDPEIARWLDSCLSLLRYVRTSADAAEWLEGSKQVMRRNSLPG